jgi:hypothetical protein
MKNFWILGMVIVVFGCKTSTALPQVDASTYSGYQEDLVGRLPDFPDYSKFLQELNTTLPTSTQSVDDQLANRMRNGYESAKGEPYFSGFTVLVYSGIDRNEAFKTRDNLAVFFPEVKAEMQYQQPRYLVKAGRYGFKVEAQRVYNKLKTQFPTARIIQDRFQRKEYTPPPATESSNAQGPN